MPTAIRSTTSSGCPLTMLPSPERIPAMKPTTPTNNPEKPPAEKQQGGARQDLRERSHLK